MKAISASIVVLAGAVLLTGGSLVGHADTALFVQAVGSLVGVIGLVVWFLALQNRSER